MTPTPLPHATSRARFGGKAAALAEALAAGLPVPDGLALEVELVEAICAGATGTEAGWLESLGGTAAVRSSAVDEDGAQASFAGQHLTVLGVRRATDLLDAVRDVHASAHEPSVLAYRARLGIAGPPRIAVVLQRMLEPRCAGVLFTRHPVTGNDERLIEASWGVGEAVVSGLVEPDRVRMRRGGEVIEQHVGVKDVAIRAAEHGMTETAVDEADRSRPCLDAEDLAALEGLAALCESAVPGAHDIEWAFVGRHLFLLQRRDVTR